MGSPGWASTGCDATVTTGSLTQIPVRKVDMTRSHQLGELTIEVEDVLADEADAMDEACRSPTGRCWTGT
jgi:hypothetical protein